MSDDKASTWLLS